MLATTSWYEGEGEEKGEREEGEEGRGRESAIFPVIKKLSDI
jgi:hypothetical protein